MSKTTRLPSDFCSRPLGDMNSRPVPTPLPEIIVRLPVEKSTRTTASVPSSTTTRSPSSRTMSWSGRVNASPPPRSSAAERMARSPVVSSTSQMALRPVSEATMRPDGRTAT